MAAYAALVSLMQIIHQIENHPSPPISLHKQQVESLTEKVNFLQEFLECYNSPVANSDEVDPLESRIANAAHAAEDVIESKIADLFYIPSTTFEKMIRSSKVFQRLFKSAAILDLQQVIDEMDLIEKEVTKAQMLRNVSSTHAGSFTSSSTGKKGDIMVGFDDVIFEVMDKLTAYQPGRLVIPIVGMGGIGKSALARTVYLQPLIKEHFDICACATISQQYNRKEILCELLSQATKIKREELSERSEDELGLELYQYLSGRRFLIVMDDMWSIDAWDKIQLFFPDNGNGSRILVTTRLSQLSSQLNNNYCLQMKFLDEVSSWDLFSKIVFGEESCPIELAEIGKKIVKNCRGLPLSIIVVGGLLKKMEDTRGFWESIQENLTSVVNLDNDKHCFKLLKMSYNHLPVYLKPCFLYMGVFEEDDEIVVSTLIRLWVSEGFIKPMNGKSLETIAEGFLQDLVDRNLILIHKLGCIGNIKCCKIHDLLRDFCLSESKKDRFYHVIGRDSPQGINSHRCVVNLRRLVGGTRSWLLITYLWNLHTLIVSSFIDNDASVGFWKMPQLRHIVFGRHALPDPPSSGSDADAVVIMKNLHTLKGVNNFKCCKEVVKRIPNIKRLLIEYHQVEDHHCLNNIKSLSKLESLTLTLSLFTQGRRNHHLQKLTFPRSIKKLTLTINYDKDMLKKIGSLPLLEKLKMISGSFTTDKWEIVEGQFPRLKYLNLLWCNGLKQWTSEESSIFPRLEQLHLSRLTELEEIPCQIGDIPMLQKIELLNCSESA